jgi:cytoskeletal protein RodZ
MIDPAIGGQLADLGGFALFLLLLVVIAVGLFRQWWVPGYMYRQERADREKADVQATRNVEALERQNRISVRIATANERNATALEQLTKVMVDDRNRQPGDADVA